MRQTAGHFVWTQLGSPAGLGRARMDAMRRFLADFPAGREQGRYVVGALPALPVQSGAFDLAVCSHFLFTYTLQFDCAFHLASIIDLCRIAAEARIFPLLTRSVHGSTGAGVRSPHVAPVLDELRRRGYVAHVEQVPYEFQRGGNEMLRVARPKQAYAPTLATGRAPVS